MVGNNVEASGGQYAQNVQQCSTQTTYENRAVGYNVTYEYAGRQYQVQTPQDPGPTIRVQVTPVLPANTPAPSGFQPGLIPSPLPMRPISQAPAVRTQPRQDDYEAVHNVVELDPVAMNPAARWHRDDLTDETTDYESLRNLPGGK